MKVSEYLENYYKLKPFFGPGGGADAERVVAYLGPFNLDVPNTVSRKRLIAYHDIHHIISGYNNSRIGEGEVSAWELGSGCLNNPLAAFFDFTSMTTGLIYSLHRVYKAFIRGRESNNFYSLSTEELLNSSMAELKKYSEAGGVGEISIADTFTFFIYASFSLFISLTLLPGVVVIRSKQLLHNKSSKKDALKCASS
jgi:hypothetical protein